MNLDDTVSGVEDQRLRFVKHKGKVILFGDLSHCKAREILLLVEQVRAIVARHAKGSMLILGDVTGAEIDKAVATRLKEVLTLDRPFVRRSAWVGMDTVPHVLYENMKSFSRRDLPNFKTREEAMDWLVADADSQESGASSQP